MYDIFSKRFADAGFPIKIAKGTPVLLSYQWKHIEKLSRKFQEWGLSIEEVAVYVQIVVSKLSTLPPAQRTIQNVAKNDMIQFCADELERRKDNQSDLIQKIENINNWLISMSGSTREEQIAFLSRRHKPGALPNIVLYYQQGKLSQQFFAFSNVCRKVLMFLNQAERCLCPTDALLNFVSEYKLRQFKPAIKSILGE